MILLLVIFSCIIFLLGTLFSDFHLMLISLFLLFFVLLIYSFKRRDVLMIYFGFLSTFFVFLLGSLFFDYSYLNYLVVTFGEETTKVVINCLYLSLLSTYLSTLWKTKSRRFYLSEESIIKYIKENNSICSVSLLFFYFTIIFKIIVNLERAIFVQMHSYVDLYVSYSSNFPWYIHKIAECSTVCFCIVLATLPSKVKIRKAVLLYALSVFIGLFSGVRGTVAYYLVFLILYYFYRQKLSDLNNLNEIWMTKRGTITLIVIAPFVLIFLSMYTFIRSGIPVTFSGFFSELINFFKQQGGSIRVIAYTDLYKEQLSMYTENISYLFGPIINLIKYGFLSSLFSGMTMIKGNTIESALYGNNLGATITYFVMPVRYLNGEGLGTQYIAEAYADFGYFGVFLFGLFLGIIIKKVNYITSDKWYINALSILIIFNILSMPRDFALTFVANLVSIKNWLIFFGVNGIANYNKKRKLRYENITD